jgi:hypothetical protein
MFEGIFIARILANNDVVPYPSQLTFPLASKHVVLHHSDTLVFAFRR